LANARLVVGFPWELAAHSTLVREHDNASVDLVMPESHVADQVRDFIKAVMEHHDL